MNGVSAAVAARRPSILVIDDDRELCDLLAEYLEHEGYAVEAAHDGARGVARALSREHALVVLDVMLPDTEGFEVLRRLRQESPVAVLMLTAKGDEQDRIRGLELGADDYLPKPFNPRELGARIAAILRRASPDGVETRVRLAVGDISIDTGARVVRQDGRALELTSVEFELLELFLRGAGQVISRDELVRTVLKREFSPFDRSIDTHVSNLRRKLGPAPGGAERIKGVRGIGYLYVLPEHDDDRG
jgi:two-component system response regulator CpxR